MTATAGTGRVRETVRLVVGAVCGAAVVVAVSLLLGFATARSLQWGLLGAAGTVGAMLLGRLTVTPLRWPDRPSMPPLVGWHGVRTAQQRLGRRGRTTDDDAGGWPPCPDLT